ncbi:MAG: hypothetical protein JWO92_2211 [Chitinophagaceae bacterium]|nr:hypothetical protein [Chitinophagaceae bacterium]
MPDSFTINQNSFYDNIAIAKIIILIQAFFNNGRLNKHRGFTKILFKLLATIGENPARTIKEYVGRPSETEILKLIQ